MQQPEGTRPRNSSSSFLVSFPVGGDHLIDHVCTLFRGGWFCNLVHAVVDWNRLSCWRIWGSLLWRWRLAHVTPSHRAYLESNFHFLHVNSSITNFQLGQDTMPSPEIESLVISTKPASWKSSSHGMFNHVGLTTLVQATCKSASSRFTGMTGN